MGKKKDINASRKRTGGIWFLALAISAITLIPLAVCHAQQADKISCIAPETCLSWHQWSNQFSADANSTNAVDRMMAEPEVHDFSKKLIDKLGQLPAILVPEDAPPALRKVAATLGPQIVDGIFRKEGCFFVETFNINQAQEPENFRAGFALNVGDNADETMAAIGQLLLTFGAPTEEAELDGQSVIKILTPGDAPMPAIVVTKHDGHLLAATGIEVLGEMKSRFTAGKIAPWLSEVQASQSYKRTSILGKIEAGKLIEKFLPLAGEQGQKMVAALGLDNLEHVEISGGFGETDYEQRFKLKFDGAPKGIFNAFGDEGISIDDIAHFPEDSFLAVAMSLDGRKAVKEFQRILIEVDPGGAEDFASGLIQIQRHTGIDVRAAIENLGPTFTLHNGLGDGIMSGAMLKADLGNVEEFNSTIKDAIGLLQNPGLDFELGVDSFEQNGKKVKSLRFGGAPIPVEPSWFADDDSVTISLFPSVLSAVNNDELMNPLVKSESFKPYLDLLEATDGQVVGFSYSESKLSYEMFHGYVCFFSAMGKNVFAGTGGVMDEVPLSEKQKGQVKELIRDLHLPSCRSVVRHLTPQVAVVRKEKDAIVLESHSSMASGNLTLFAPGVAVGMLLPAVQQVRAAARRTESMNNLRQFALAALNYESAHQHFPSGDGPVKKGGPPVSWRVKVLPFLEHAHLYDQYNVDEPWDSETNLKVLKQMPPVFQNPASAAEPNHTVYRGIGGTTGIMGVDAKGKSKGATFMRITDGSSNTILFVESPDRLSVPWTKPDGGIDPEKIKPRHMVGNHPGGFNVAFADRSCHFISGFVDEETFKSLMQMNDGNIVGDF